jgi:hypothetical protein
MHQSSPTGTGAYLSNVYLGVIRISLQDLPRGVPILLQDLYRCGSIPFQRLPKGGPNNFQMLFAVSLMNFQGLSI